MRGTVCQRHGDRQLEVDALGGVKTGERCAVEGPAIDAVATFTSRRQRGATGEPARARRRRAVFRVAATGAGSGARRRMRSEPSAARGSALGICRSCGVVVAETNIAK